MAEGVSRVVSPTAYIAADEADPQVGIRMADPAFIEAAIISQARVIMYPFPKTKVVLSVAAYGTAGSTPFLKTGAVEDMLAEDSQETCGFVHALKTDRAGGQFDQRWSGRSVWFGGS